MCDHRVCRYLDLYTLATFHSGRDWLWVHGLDERGA
jgi:hypothetical protein